MSLSGGVESDPIRWSTSQVLDWMTNFADSKEGIKLKIMNIVQENDLDGHALKQLRDDPEELHDLLPVLKERLTFKAMMKGLIGVGQTSSRRYSVHSMPHSSRGPSGPQSPSQLPSTSFESPPIPNVTNSASSLIGDQLSRSALPSFSTFVSAQGQDVLSSSQCEPSTETVTSHADYKIFDGEPRERQGEIYTVYATGILPDAGSHYLPAQSTVYGSQTPMNSESSNSTPCTSSNLIYTNKEDVSASDTHEGTLYASGWFSGRKSHLGRKPSTRKALEITQKYNKILQKVRSSPDNDYYHGMQIPYPAPLPTLSPILKQQVDKGNVLSFKTRFVYECAQFYMSINPTPTHTAYRNISMTIVKAYPELADQTNGKEPWKQFSTSLSQAIRNIRRRLRSVPGTGFPPASRRYQPNRSRNIDSKRGNHGQESPVVAVSNADQGQTISEMSESILIKEDDSLDESSTTDVHDDDVKGDDDSDSEVKEIVIPIVVKAEDEGSVESDSVPQEWTNDNTSAD